MADIIHIGKFGGYKDIKALMAELRKNPKSAELHFLLGRELLQVNTPANRKKGSSHLEKAIRLNPACAAAYKLLADEIMVDNPKKGACLSKKAAELYRAAGENKRAEAILEEAAMHYVYSAWDKVNDDTTTNALKDAERALKIYPDCIDALNVYGAVYIQRCEFKKAEENYQKAIDIAVRKQGGKERIKNFPYWLDFDSRSYMSARHGMGIVQIYLGEFAKALDQFKLMLKMNPNDNQGARFMLGDVCLLMDDIKRAEKYYNEYGGANGALMKLIKGDKAGAKRELNALKKENPFIVELLWRYLSDYNVSAYIDVPDNDPVKIFAHPKYKYVLIGVKRDYSYDGMDYFDYQQFKAACDFCKLYGPLWIKHGDSDFVYEVHKKRRQR